MSNQYYFLGTRTTFIRAWPKIFCRVNGALVFLIFDTMQSLQEIRDFAWSMTQAYNNRGVLPTNFPAEIFNLNVSHLISIRTQTSCSHRTGVLKIDVKATVESTLLVSKGLGFRQLGSDPWKVLGRKALYLKVFSSFTTTPQFQRESSLDWDT